MDLSSIRGKAVALMYKSSSEFVNDFCLLLSNCETFNGKDAPLSDVARDMLTRVQIQLNDNDLLKEIDNFLKENINFEDDGSGDHLNIDQGDDVSIMTDHEELEANEASTETEAEADVDESGRSGRLLDEMTAIGSDHMGDPGNR